MAEKKTLSKQRARSILQAASKKVVLVTGDAMLDQFIWGEVDRISPEAPVQIVDIDQETTGKICNSLPSRAPCAAPRARSEAALHTSSSTESRDPGCPVAWRGAAPAGPRRCFWRGLQ